MFALAGLDWRSWTAADCAAVTFLLLKREYAGDADALRGLYELTEDTEKLAELARGAMGQDAQVEAKVMGVRRG